MAAICSALPAFSVEVGEFEGGAHGFPAVFDLAGKKLADGDFSQWMEDGRLHVRITYHYKSGQRIEEKAVLRPKPELLQERWLWRESKGDMLEREFAVDFKTQMATAKKRENGVLRTWSEKIEVQLGRAFAGFGFALALQNLRGHLLHNESIELQAVGFNPKPVMVPVELSHSSIDEMEMADRLVKGDRFVIHPKIPAIAKLFVNVTDIRIWLTKPPAGFLRWEGPIAEPEDAIIRVDLIPGAQSGAAKVVERGSN
jgi:hypothetical protein